MRRHSLLALTLALSACTPAQSSPQRTVDPVHAPAAARDPRVIAAATNALGLDLYPRLATSPHANLVFSPASIELALAMTWGGARGATADEMARVLYLTGADPSAVHEGASAQLALWEGTPTEGLELSVANRLYGERTYQFHEAYLALTRDAWRAPLTTHDFMGDPEGGRQLVNQWVSETTHQRIPEVLPAGSITGDTRLVLVNAIYMNARWALPFADGRTTSEIFHARTEAALRLCADGTERCEHLEETQVPTMHQSDERFRYAHFDELRALALPFVGGSLETWILLPDDRFGLERLEARLTPELLSRIERELESREVIVSLPRFRVDPPSSLALRETLSALGMPLAFTEAADLSGMAEPGQAPLMISDVYHDAYLALDENGVEAAASTAVVTVLTSAMIGGDPPEVFAADHPFVFLVRDTRTGAVLFLGRVVDPRT